MAGRTSVSYPKANNSSLCLNCSRNNLCLATDAIATHDKQILVPLCFSNDRWIDILFCKNSKNKFKGK